MIAGSLKMAEASACQQHTPKVGCRSKRSVCNIFETISSKALSVVQDFEDLNKEERERITVRFKEIYETALYQNVLVDGQNLHDLKNHGQCDETTEYEPVDLEKKKYINETMFAKLDDAIVRTTQRRKHCPAKYRNRLTKLTNKSVSNIAHLKVECSSILSETENGIGTLSCKELQDRLKETESELSLISKATSESVCKAEGLKTCTKMFQCNKKRNTKSSNDTKKVNNDIEVTPSRKRKVQSETPTSPKKVKRHSPRLLKKFSTHKPRLRIDN